MARWLPIPCIDKCDLPNDIIDKCYDVYCRYGKYKIYDVLNKELDNAARFTAEELEKYKNDGLIKRYLYLYRQAMIQTMSFVYNTDEYEINSSDRYSVERHCPKCGEEYKYLPQIGQFKGYPLSHYDDITVDHKYKVLFNVKPVSHPITISFNDFISTRTSDEITDYKFVRWSIHEDGTPMSDAERNDSVFKYISETNKMLKVYAVYTNDIEGNTQVSYRCIEQNFFVRIGEIVEKQKSFPTEYDYVFGYYGVDLDDNELPIKLDEEALNRNAYDYKTNNNKLGTVAAFTCDECDYSVNWKDRLEELYIQFIKESTYREFTKIALTSNESVATLFAKLNEPAKYLNDNFVFSHWALTKDSRRPITEEEFARAVLRNDEISFFAIYYKYIPTFERENYLMDRISLISYGDQISFEDLDSPIENFYGDGNYITLYEKYTYNIPEGIYCYDDSAYFCSISDAHDAPGASQLVGIGHYEPNTRLTSDKITLKAEVASKVIDLINNAYDSEPTKLGKKFLRWSLKENGSELTNTEKNRIVLAGRTVDVYAVFISALFRCPYCNKKVAYRGYLNNGSYIKNGLLRILRYVDGKWNRSYKNDNVDTNYGYIYEVSTLKTLFEKNKVVGLSDGDLCVDTYKYSDITNAAYKIYTYESKRDANYNKDAVDNYDDSDDPENYTNRWIYIPQEGDPDYDPVEIITLDTTGVKKNKYILRNIVKCYEMQNGSIIRKHQKTNKITGETIPMEITFEELASVFRVSSEITISVSSDEDNVNYTAKFVIGLDGFSIDNIDEYDIGDTQQIELIKEFPIVYSAKSTFDESSTDDESNIALFEGGETYVSEDEQHVLTVEGGYPTKKSIVNVTTGDDTGSIGGREDLIDSFGASNDKFRFPKRKEKGLEEYKETQISVEEYINSTSAGVNGNISISGGTLNTEGFGNNTSMLLDTTVVDESGSIIDDENYDGPNYSGWYWLAEDTNLFHDIDATDGDVSTGISRGRKITNTLTYSTTLYALMKANQFNESLIHPLSRNSTYRFLYYSIDGYSRATDTKLLARNVAPGEIVTIYRIYQITSPVGGLGMIESEIIDKLEDYVDGGFQRTLFTGDFNSTGGLKGYCDNPNCPNFKKILRQRKWSYRNDAATVKNYQTQKSESSFTLDDYASYPNAGSTYKTANILWRYPQKDVGKTVMLHRGGSGDIDKFRFEFEYKYATDEYSTSKHNLPSQIPDKSKLLTQNMKKIYGSKIVPMYERPIEVYNEVYKTKLVEKFKEIYSEMVIKSPFSLLTESELDVMYEVIQDFSFMTRLTLISFINTWNHYISYSAGRWFDEDTYKSLIKRVDHVLTALLNDNRVDIGKKGSPKYVYKKELLINNFIDEDYSEAYQTYALPISAYISTPINVVCTEEYSSVKNLIPNTYPTATDGYRFDHWSLTENGDEPFDSDLNAGLKEGENITFYAVYVKLLKDKLEELAFNDNDFLTVEAFVNKYYTDDFFIAKSKEIFEEEFGEKFDGRNKEWFSRTYSDSDYEVSIRDYMDSYTEVEFKQLLQDILSVEIVETELKTGYAERDLTLLMREADTSTDNPNLRFRGWSLDGYNIITDYILDEYVVPANTTVKIYKVYEYIIDGDNSDLSKDWYYGKDETLVNVKDMLADIHEQLALPLEFIVYLIGVMIWPKRFIAMTDSKGNVGAYYLSASIGIPCESDLHLLMHKNKQSSGNHNFDIQHAVVSKKFSAAKNTDTNDSIYEQYFVTTDGIGGNIQVYSFMKNSWVDDIYEGSDAYKYCLLLKNTSNPSLTIPNTSKLIKIVPFKNFERDSVLAFVYDSCIVFFDCFENEWLSNYILPDQMFSTTVEVIKDCDYDDEDNTIVLLSTNGQMTSVDLETFYFSTYDGRSRSNNLISFCPKNDNSVIAEEENGDLPENVQVRSLSVVNTDGTKSSITDAIYVMQIANLKPVTLEEGEYPWILKDNYSVTPVLLKEISDEYRKSLPELDRDKYYLNSKLTIRAEFEKVDTTQKTAVVEYNGSKYNFARLSLRVNGVSIEDYELDTRLEKSIGVYAIYYKEGVDIDADFGYKYNIETLYVESDKFKEYLNKESEDQGNFGMTLGGSLQDKTLPTYIDRIYVLDSTIISGEVVKRFAAVIGNVVKIMIYREGKFSVISAVGFDDDIPVSGIVRSDTGSKVYIVYENQKIVELSTYQYTPSIYQEASTTGEIVSIVGDSFDIPHLFVNYVGDSDETHCVQINNSEYRYNRYHGVSIKPRKYVIRDGAKLTKYVDANIEQSDFEFYTSELFKWLTLEGEKVDYKVQIN